ncbi:hypothetical protein D3C80_1376930 [compost metagenome]
MPRLVGEAGLGQLDIPIVLADQVIGIAKAQGIAGLAERHGFFLGAAQLAQHRVLACRLQQFAQVACRGHVAGGQAGRLDVVGAGHAQCLGLGVHGGNKGGIATRVVVGQARGRAVFRGHQGDQQHFLARQFAIELDPREHAFHFRGVGDGHGNVLVHILLGFQHHQAGHQLGHRGDGHHDIGVAGIDDLVGLQVDQHGAARGDMQFRGVARCRSGFTSIDVRRDDSA